MEKTYRTSSEHDGSSDCHEVYIEVKVRLFCSPEFLAKSEEARFEPG